MSLRLMPFASLTLILTGSASVPEPPQGREPILPVAAPFAPGPDGKVDLAQTGIGWVEGIDAALGRGKPILLFQLLGRLDDALC